MSNMKVSNLDEYDYNVASLFKLDSSDKFGNHGVVHARIVCKHIFLNSKKEVQILSNNLPSKCGELEMYSWEPLQDAVHTFIDKKNGRLKIIVGSQDIDKNTHPLFIKTNKKDNIEIQTADSDKLTVNYSVGDNKMYRFEKDSKADDATAEACANDTFFSRVLSTHFSNNWQSDCKQ